MTLEAYQRDVLDWIRGLLVPSYTFVLGVNGPQGGGKSTLTAAVCRQLGDRAVTVSIDDFYLTRAEQMALAARHPRDPYLQQRGYPGTHDVALGARVLDELRARSAGTVRIPRYDKSAFGGQGDRAAGSFDAHTPLDLVILEGWMLGFRPADVRPELREVNALLANYSAWTDRLDGFLQLDPEDYHFVLDWRVEAEERMKAAGKPGMSEAEIRAYIEKFLPAYEAWLPGLRASPPTAHHRRIRIGKNRLPLP